MGSISEPACLIPIEFERLGQNRAEARQQLFAGSLDQAGRTRRQSHSQSA